MTTENHTTTTSVIPFQFDEYDIRIHVDSKGNPWWEAQDVCAVLSIKDVSQAIARLSLGEKRTCETRNVLIINESGLYRLIFRSNKPDARRFQDWVFEEVLPRIRRTGRYDASLATKSPTPKETLDTLAACQSALKELGCFDDRDTITFAAYVRRIAATAMQPLLPMANDPTQPAIDGSQPVLWTMSMRLQFLRYAPLVGKDGEGKQIRIGSIAAKNYKSAYKELPKKLWDFVKGQQRQVNAYPPERVHILDDAIETVLGPPHLQIAAVK